jgi:hypothetical protein
MREQKSFYSHYTRYDSAENYLLIVLAPSDIMCEGLLNESWHGVKSCSESHKKYSSSFHMHTLPTMRVKKFIKNKNLISQCRTLKNHEKIRHGES